MLTVTVHALRSADPTTLTVAFDADTGAVNVHSAEGALLALGVFDLDRWEFTEPEDLGELPPSGPMSNPDAVAHWASEIEAALRGLLEDREAEEADTWDGDDSDRYDDGADDAYALASAYGYDPEYC